MSTDVTNLETLQEPVTALIQGASRGIGLEIVRQLLERESVARVFASCRSLDAAAALTRLTECADDRLHPVSMDVSAESSVESAAAQVTKHTDRLDLIINCAGLLHDSDGMRPERRLADVQPEHMLRSYQVNTIGPALVAKHFHKLLPAQNRAVFASLSARVGSISDNNLGGWYAYRAAKAAQNMITRNLAIELRRRSKGVICVALHPGTVDTDLSQPFQKNVPADRLFSPELAVRQLLTVIGSLTQESNGHFYAWDGSEIPW